MDNDDKPATLDYRQTYRRVRPLNPKGGGAIGLLLVLVLATWPWNAFVYVLGLMLILWLCGYYKGT